MYENIRVPEYPLLLGVSAPQPWVPQPSLNLAEYGRFFVGGGGGVSVNRYGHVETVSSSY